MDWQKILNIAAIGLVAWLLLIEWEQFDRKNQQPLGSPEVYVPDANESDLPSAQANDMESELPSVIDESLVATAPAAVNRLVVVTTDVLQVTIDTLGGDIVDVRLLEHFTEMDGDNRMPFTLLNRSADSLYVAQSGLIGKNGTDTAAGRPEFAVASSSYNLGMSDSISVDLTLNQEGVRIVKRFEFFAGDYTIGVNYLINNLTSEPWQANFYGQIRRDSKPPMVTSSGGVMPFLGAAIRKEDKNYAKYDFGDMEDESVTATIKGGWVAMIQHYFVSAWIPPKEDKNAFSLRKSSGKDLYLMDFTGQRIAVAPGDVGEYRAQFYAGPKDQERLADLAEYLDLTIDYGFLWLVAKPLFAGLKMIQSFIGNWGWSILLLTLVIKIALYPLSAASLKSMAKMRNLQPEMARLKELYGDDRQKMSQELMGLYKKEKVNPAGGCFPMLLQMPVFIALYWVLLESVEIRHSPWIFWIQDLSAKDPLFVLPILMGASMILMQKLQPMPTDPMQAKVMKFLPIMFTFFFMLFPAGLVLYWTVNNLLSMAQQWVVNRQLQTVKKN